ncbi:MAG: double-strand break repair helicase AddA [Pseudomonadota bacterium]
MVESIAFKDTVANQIRAASPDLSAFVSANAGSGKTRVLTTRVARLLLAGVPPSRLLCITFTKAAAAEMADRLFKMLGEWSLASDKDLEKALATIGAPLKDSDKDKNLARARRLFATALETPGGLKIQTIHAFCETVLKRFPLEAGVAPGFTVIEDADATRLKAEAISSICTSPKNEEISAINLLSHNHAPSTVRQQIEASISNEKRRTALINENYVDRVAAALDISPQIDPATLIAEINDHIDLAKIEAFASALLYGGKTAVGLGEKLTNYSAISDPNGRIFLLKQVFFTSTGTIRVNIADAKAKKAAPNAEALETELKTAVTAFIETVRAAQTLNQAKALATLTRSAAQHYETSKAARAALDFDDLIQKTRSLLEDNDRAQWVMYKLDQGIDHILLDEAQDTSPDAWRVIEAPLKEFFAGSGAYEAKSAQSADQHNQATTTNRTFFAVGDQKQSIYSFQGADAELFQTKATDLGKSISAVAPFAEVPLNLSFRTSEPVLAFVDALFSDPTVLDGVSVEKPLRHDIFRTKAPGRVELWPLTPAEKSADLKPWNAPLDALTSESPERKLATAVADEIKHLLGNKDILWRDHHLRAGDIMILVQNRGPLFREMIKALSLADIPAAGADKLKLMDDQAAKDLFCFARTVLFEGDDLSLAETLKSPFFNYSDEMLFDLAYGRTGSLHRALTKRAQTDNTANAVLAALNAAGHIARTNGPFAFFTHLLETGQPSGRKRILARLGPPARDPLNALLSLALDFEQSNPRSLTQFLDWAAERDAEVHRDAENAGDVVRVMTAHKSKGLEAPVVFLMDAHRKAPSKDSFLVLRNALSEKQFTDPLPILQPTNDMETAVSKSAKKYNKQLDTDEYRRLLYVAATRARDLLYICGIEGKRASDPHKPSPPNKTWHALAEDAFTRLKASGHTISTLEKWQRPVLRLEKTGTGEPDPTAPKTVDARKRSAQKELPIFFTKTARLETPARRIQPSHLAEKLEALAREERAISPASAGDALLRGNCLHKLLELSTHQPDKAWVHNADRLLGTLAPDVPEATRDEWREEANRVLKDPTFAEVFGTLAKAEVSIGGKLPNGTQLNGQIDRLLVKSTKILIVDFKTNRPPPKRVEETPPSYLAQMGAYAYLLAQIYPERSIQTAILWTFEARLTHLPEKLTKEAFNSTLS